MYYQLLVLASFLIAGYQDAKERLVTDFVWIPAVIGAALVFVFHTQMLFALVVRIALIGGIAYLFTRLGSVGQADAIAFVLLASDPAPFSPIPVLVATGVFALGHIGFLYVRGTIGKPKTITIQQFNAESKWIPKSLIVNGIRTEVTSDVNVSRDRVEDSTTTSTDGNTMVEVQYGVPQVTYIAAGYVAYLVYLLVFQPALIFSLP